ncbi:hypothetical protein BHE74_00033928 [Ensete ventricosum]|nr:hypothetical protein GW17_00040451 [Ensete ventricosum]RWW59153.1 hypothetical protein BHE74_00033928 [Ensete ventricosum]
MLYPGVTQEWVDEGELPRERTKNRRWQRSYDVLAEATHGEVIVRSHKGDLIIQRYDRSGWRVGLLQCSHSLKGAQQVRGQGRVVEKSEEAMTSLVGLNYLKAKHRLERRWTQRSIIVLQRRIYRSRRKGCKCKTMDSRAMGFADHGIVEAGLSWSHRSLALIEGDHWS